MRRSLSVHVIHCHARKRYRYNYLICHTAHCPFLTGVFRAFVLPKASIYQIFFLRAPNKCRIGLLMRLTELKQNVNISASVYVLSQYADRVDLRECLTYVPTKLIHSNSVPIRLIEFYDPIPHAWQVPVQCSQRTPSILGRHWFKNCTSCILNGQGSELYRSADFTAAV